MCELIGGTEQTVVSPYGDRCPFLRRMLRSVVLNRVRFHPLSACPRNHLATSGDIFGFTTGNGGVCYWSVEGRDVAKHHQCRTASHTETLPTASIVPRWRSPGCEWRLRSLAPWAPLFHLQASNTSVFTVIF